MALSRVQTSANALIQSNIKTYLNSINQDFYLDLHQIVLTHRQQPPYYTIF